MGLTTLLINHLQNRREAEEVLRLRKEREQDRAEVRAERDYIKEQAKRPKPLTPSEFERALRAGLTTPRSKSE